jgi:hypothetical protein
MLKKLLSTFLATILIAGSAHAEIDTGNGQQTASVAGQSLTVYTYRSSNCTPRLMLVVFHGSERDAGPYRDVARPLADKLCAIVISPEFDHKRFPDNSYQLGGVVVKGSFVPPGRRPIDLVAPLIAWARVASNQPTLPVALFAHSAGGQFIGRVAAFARTDGARIVLINPSTWVLPSTTVAVPYGFGGSGTPAEEEQALRAYLALPITVLLGTADTGTTNLAMDPAAMAQGPNRLMRARNAFAMAEAMAREHGWSFGWRKLEAPGVGHREAGMFATSQAVEALQ